MSRARTSSARVVLVLELLIEHEPLLEFNDVFALTGLDRELRQKVLENSTLWESLTRSILPSLRAVPKLTPRGRAGFLWCLRLSREDTLRVRPTPIPDAFRRGVETPTSITFLLDVFTGEYEHVSSNAWPFKLDAEGNVTIAGNPVRRNSLSAYSEFVVSPSRMKAFETLVFSSAKARRIEVGRNSVTIPVSARVILSFVVDDEGPPIVLLNEFESFFNGEDHLEFSTDVNETWLRHADFSSSAGLSDALSRRGAKFQAGCDLRYGPRSLPFDPVVRVYLSPAGMDRRFDEQENPLITCDSADHCSGLIEIDFQKSEDCVPIDKLISALLRLREDQKRQALF